MTTLHLRRRSTLWLAVASVFTFGVADMNLPLLIVSVPGAFGAWFLSQAPLGRPLPRLIINLLLLGILAYTLFAVATEGFSVTTVCEIITLTLLAKILDRRSQRDYGQVISISAFLCIGTILTSNSFWVGLLLLVCLGLLIAATVNYQIEQLAAGSATENRIQAATGRAFHRQVRRLVLFMFVFGVIISALVFVAVPRKLGAGLFGEWGNPRIGQVTGFADEVELGMPGFISPSSTPVLDLEVTGRDGEQRGGSGVVFYLRGAVLDTYEDGRWTRNPDWVESTQRSQTDHLLRGFQVLSEPRYWSLKQKITIRNAAATRSHLFSIWRPVFLEPSQPSVFYKNLNDGTLIRESESGKFEYTVFSRDFEQRNRYVGGRDWTPSNPVEATNMNTERFQILASRLLEDAGVDPNPQTRPAEQIERASITIQDYFNTGFIYTLEAEPVPSGLDPTEWFLFDRRAGHCEYYASAMATLGRSVGINMRVITGYVATEFNEATGHYVVRQSSAHAWVEAEVGPGVWYTFDPTPPSDFQRLHEPSQSFLAQVRRLLDAAEYAWIRAVVDYDSGRQERLVRSAFNTSWTPDRSIEDLVQRLQKGGPRAILKFIGVILGFLAFIAVVVVLVTKYLGSMTAWMSRIWSVLRLSVRPKTDIDAIYKRFLRELDGRGVAKPTGVPLLTHVCSVGETWPDEERETAARLARNLYRARFDDSGSDLARVCASELALVRTRRRRRSRDVPA
jgi:protein-glutamine gamma-glutamyltransferase